MYMSIYLEFMHFDNRLLVPSGNSFGVIGVWDIKNLRTSTFGINDVPVCLQRICITEIILNNSEFVAN